MKFIGAYEFWWLDLANCPLKLYILLLRVKEVPNSSYVWSLMAAQPILEKGCWRVGNGSSISVIHDRWIPKNPTNKVLHLPLEEEWEWRVNELIDWNVRGWDRELITAKFHKEDTEAILRIPLCRRYAPDFLFWFHTKSGEYTVRSG